MHNIFKARLKADNSISEFYGDTREQAAEWLAQQINDMMAQGRFVWGAKIDPVLVAGGETAEDYNNPYTIHTWA